MSLGDHESSASTQKDAQKMPSGYKLDTLWLSEASQNEETRNTATSFLESPTDFSGMYTYQREPEEEIAKSWTYRSRESDATGGICFLPSD